MLVSVEGVYRNGRVELIESPNNVPEGACVIVTFVSSNDIIAFPVRKRYIIDVKKLNQQRSNCTTQV
jgi:hypothetical protein